MKSSTGVMNLLTRSLVPAQMPSGMPMTARTAPRLMTSAKRVHGVGPQALQDDEQEDDRRSAAPPCRCRSA